MACEVRTCGVYLELWKFHSMGWYKTLVVGILLKISIICVVMEFIECCLHIKNGCAKGRCVALPQMSLCTSKRYPSSHGARLLYFVAHFADPFHTHRIWWSPETLLRLCKLRSSQHLDLQGGTLAASTRDRRTACNGPGWK